MDSKAWLRQIIDTADALRCKTSRTSGSTTRPSAGPLITPDVPPLLLNIPLPSHLVPELMAAGAPKKVAEAISAKFYASAKQLADHQSNIVYVGALRKLDSLPSLGQSDFLPAFQEAHRQTYHRALSKWKDDITNSVRGRFGQALEAAEEGQKSKAFDQNFVPFLEKCFATNQRPAREDKELLARKSGMSYRQIHVWFQNRRSRTRKAHGTGISDVQGAQIACSRASSVTLVGDDHFATNESPSYAFPEAYPPNIPVEEDPFPCRHGDFSSFMKPCWPRSSSTKCHSCGESDVSGLIMAFEKLQIGDNGQPDIVKTDSAPLGSFGLARKSGCDVTRPYTVRPLRAPLASLIRNAAACFSRLSCISSSDDTLTRRYEDADVVASPQIEGIAKPKSRKAHYRLPPTAPGSAVSAVQNSAPFSNEQTSSSTLTSLTASASTSSADPPSKVKKSAKRPPSKRASAASTSKRSKDRGAPAVQAAQPSSEPPAFHPSPAASIDSLPSLSYSSGSSSASTCSQSPTTSFVTLPDDDLLPSLDTYQSSDASLTLPSAPTLFDDFQSRMFPSSGMPFDFSKGPLDYTFNLDLPTYPSYSDSFDSISRGLQSSPDFAPPALTFDLPSFSL